MTDVIRQIAVGVVVLLGAALTALGAATQMWWLLVVGVVVLAVGLLGVYDLVQTKHSILRNYPVLAHLRFLLEDIRPEIYQYFIESNTDGAPFDRDTRALVYQRAKGVEDESPFGTERNVNEIGYEFFAHSLRAHQRRDVVPRIRIGGPDCPLPYDLALLNVSAMSFGALSGNAVEALNGGAALGGFAQDTGEGSISVHHRKRGGDLIWELGSGYFGCRTEDGGFDAEKFAEQASSPQVRAISIKLSQGAKPGLGGVLPGSKVTQEIADARGVPIGETVISPPAHQAFDTPVGLIDFVDRLRELSGGKPVGFKLCIGSRHEFLAILKAIIERGSAPDFIIVDGSEGGTGAAPLEFEDNVGTPLTEGLIFVHNALVGAGLRDRIKVGASGKVATGADIVKRLCQGADFTMAARAMMFAVGCIQAQACQTNHCPVGVATQDPRRARALDVEDKRHRVMRFQQATVHSAQQIIASIGVDSYTELGPHHLFRRIDHQTTRSYAQLYHWLERGELLEQPPPLWVDEWERADPHDFRARSATN